MMSNAELRTIGVTSEMPGTIESFQRRSTCISPSMLFSAHELPSLIHYYYLSKSSIAMLLFNHIALSIAANTNVTTASCQLWLSL